MIANDKARKILAGGLMAAFACVGILGIVMLVRCINHYRWLEGLPEPSRDHYRSTTVMQISVLGVGLIVWLFVMIQLLRRYFAWCRPGAANAE